jgi:hypothetical protein
VVVRVRKRIVAEQVAQAQHDRIDVGKGALMPQEEDVATADLEQLALVLLEQTIELARGDAQLIVPPIVRLQARQMEVDDAPVLVVTLQLPDVREQLGFDLVVLRCLHDRLKGAAVGMGSAAHLRPVAPL